MISQAGSTEAKDKHREVNNNLDEARQHDSVIATLLVEGEISILTCIDDAFTFFDVSVFVWIRIPSASISESGSRSRTR
jgi:hypothetical protein